MDVITMYTITDARQLGTAAAAHAPQASARLAGAGAVPSLVPHRPADDAEWRLEHRPEAAGQARRLARALLAGWNTPEDEAEAAVLVISELVTNAIEHADPPLVLHLHRRRADQRVWIGVTDGGPAAEDGAWSASCTQDEHGRGLYLVKALTQDHGMHRHTNGTTYWARMAAYPPLGTHSP
ncbi:ATP-binding protein [Streptomyces chartreusis]|uniref:ATP-binding protein n=1 Tax=Streptomyces chartreusis TaxID=1969 RepID=UPI00381B0088